MTPCDWVNPDPRGLDLGPSTLHLILVTQTFYGKSVWPFRVSTPLETPYQQSTAARSLSWFRGR